MLLTYYRSVKLIAHRKILESRKFLSIMSKLTANGRLDETFSPPAVVKGIKVLDKTLFEKSVTLPYFPVPKSRMKEFVSSFKLYLLKRKITDIGDFRSCSTDKKAVLLKPGVEMGNFSIEEVKKFTELNVGELAQVTIALKYEDYTRKEILQGILPQDEELASGSGFTQVGHIIHLNLREHLLEFKSVIGAVLLDSIKAAKTVVNKTSEIDSTFRVFSMELVCGEENYITRVIQNGLKFDLDFSKVFWNSRLQTEHELVCNEIEKQSTVFDVFAGIGPFSLRLAKKRRCKVFANDLNPDSCKWLKHNARLNKVADMVMYNLDGRDFIQTAFKNHIINNNVTDSKIVVIMNLPEIAVDFLNSFAGLIKGADSTLTDGLQKLEITVYCYTFVKYDFADRLNEASKQESVRNILKESLLGFEPLNLCFHNVRTISNTKDMFRCKFTLPNEILHFDEFEPNCKKVKLSC